MVLAVLLWFMRTLVFALIAWPPLWAGLVCLFVIRWLHSRRAVLTNLLPGAETSEDGGSCEKEIG
jgi:hypothetical protein